MIGPTACTLPQYTRADLRHIQLEHTSNGPYSLRPNTSTCPNLGHDSENHRAIVAVGGEKKHLHPDSKKHTRKYSPAHPTLVRLPGYRPLLTINPGQQSKPNSTTSRYNLESPISKLRISVSDRRPLRAFHCETR